MSSQQQERDRVNREQDYVKEKGREVVEKAKDVKEGNVKAEMPSNDKVAGALQKGEAALDRFQSTDRGQQVGEPAQKVIGDLKAVLSDQQVILNQQNDGDLLQNIIRHFWCLLQELRHDPALRDLFEEWQGNFTSLMSSGDLTQFFYQAGDILTSLKDTEEFMDLLSHLIDVLKTTIAEKTEQITEGQTAEAYSLQKQQQRDAVVHQIKATLVSLSENDTWTMFVMKQKEVGHRAKDAGHVTTESAQQVAYRVQDSDNFQLLVNDFKVLLQRLVGQQRSVDPLFDYSKGAVNDILEDDELAYLIDELHILLKMIVEDPALLDDDTTQQRVSNLADRADAAVDKLRQNKNIVGAKEESRQIAAAIKNEPTSAKFINDLKTLWNDLASDRPGELVDTDVMKGIRQMIIPLFLEHLNNVPLPAVHDSANFLGKYEYSIENMKISLPELIPDNIHLRFEMDVDAKPLELEAETKHTYLYIQASNIQVHLKDASFSYNRLTVPKLHDSGVFDVDTTGSGMAVWMKMELKGDTKSKQALTVLKSNVKINQKFHISFHESHHDKLYEMLTHIFANKIKRGVIDMMNEKLKTFGNYFSEQLMALIEQARTRSSDLARIAKEKKVEMLEKKEDARQGIQNLKLQAKEKVNETTTRSDVQETKEDAKKVTKGLVARGSEIIQDKLDEQKLKIEEQKREKELDRMMNEPAPELLYDSRKPGAATIDSTSILYNPNLPSTQSM